MLRSDVRRRKTSWTDCARSKDIILVCSKIIYWKILLFHEETWLWLITHYFRCLRFCVSGVTKGALIVFRLSLALTWDADLFASKFPVIHSFRLHRLVPFFDDDALHRSSFTHLVPHQHHFHDYPVLSMKLLPISSSSDDDGYRVG